EGMKHFEAVGGEVGPAASPARRDAYLTTGPMLVSWLMERGIRFVRCEGDSDYYDNIPGGNPRGRAIEAAPFHAAELGESQAKLQPCLARGIGLVVRTNELRSLMHFNRSPQALATAARVQARTYAYKARHKDILTNGASLVGQLLKLALSRQIKIWT